MQASSDFYFIVFQIGVEIITDLSSLYSLTEADRLLGNTDTSLTQCPLAIYHLKFDNNFNKIKIIRAMNGANRYITSISCESIGTLDVAKSGIILIFL